MNSIFHHFTGRCGLQTEGECVTAFGALVDLLLSLLKLFAGVFGHSSAMIADGLHSLSDAVSDVVVLISLRLSRKEPTTRYAYGFKRVESLGVLFIGILLAGFALSLVLDSLLLLSEPSRQSVPETFAIYLAAFCLVVKEGYFWVSYSIAKRTGSQLLLANAYHSRTDVYTSVLVFTGLVATQFTYPWLDQLLALFVAALVIWQAVRFIQSGISELLDENLPDDKRSLIEDLILHIDGVSDLHELRARKLANHYLLECHIVVRPDISVSEGHYLAECAEQLIRNICPDVSQVSIHVDTFGDSLHRSENLLPSRKEIICALRTIWYDLVVLPDYNALGIHYRENHIELDVICPFSAGLLEKHTRFNFERRLYAAVNQLSWLKAVNLYYQAEPASSYSVQDMNLAPALHPIPDNVVYFSCHQGMRNKS